MVSFWHSGGFAYHPGFMTRIIKMFRTKAVRDINLPTFVQFSPGMSWWALYGFHSKGPHHLSASGIGVLILIIATGLYLFYAGRYLKGYEGSIS